MSVLLIYIMCSRIYFLMFILVPMSSLSHIYRLNRLDISTSGLEKALKHLPNLVELKYVYVELIIQFGAEEERMLCTCDSQFEWTKRHVHI